MTGVTETIRSYYDQNTRLFLAFSGSKKAQNIHRSLWTDGAKTLEDALNVSNARILREILTVAPDRACVIDLGCGVGASLFYMVPRMQETTRAVGVTISAAQANLARKSAKRLGLQDEIHFAQGDFTAVPLESGWDAVYSIEAIFHAPDLQEYFLEASRLLHRGGKLILLDDFQTERPLSQAEEDWLKAYVDGWHLPGMGTVEQVDHSAEKHNLRLVKNEALTPHLRLRNLPDVLARAIRFIGNHLPIRHAIRSSMLGSMALQQCLHGGIVEYRFLVFEKMEDRVSID
jgi:cyclopropane fatty-acyl-phospholipid synthase-like methyltransferase